MAISLFLLVLLVPATVLLFLGGPESWQHLRSLKELWNLGHIVYFAILTILLNNWSVVAARSIRIRWIVSLSLVLVLGVLIELLQYGTSRTPDLLDISRDVAGCLLVLAFYPRFITGWHQRSRLVMQILVGVILLVHLWPFTAALADEISARYQFPVLADFSTGLELQRWQGEARIERVKLEPVKDDHQLKIYLTTSLYSGTGLKYLPADWSEYEAVNLKFYQPSPEPLRLTIRIHDDRHNNAYSDRFNKNFSLTKGWTTITIPLNQVRDALALRKMDLKAIRDISFFVVKLTKPRTLYLEEVYLANQ